MVQQYLGAASHRVWYSSARKVIQFICGRGSLWFLFLAILSHPAITAARQLADDQVAAEPVEVLPDADQLVFAEKLERAISEGDVATYNDLVDWNHIIDLAMEGVNASTEMRTAYKQGFLGAIQKNDSNGLAGTLVKSVQQGGNFKFLRLSVVDHAPIATFRLNLPGKGGANYQQYFLKRSLDGMVRATDMYVFLTAERMSQTVRHAWVGLVQESKKTLLEKLTTSVDPHLAAHKPMQEIEKLIANGEYEKALEVYKKTSEKVQQDKTLLIYRLRAAQLLSSEEYQSAIEDYQKYHPNDPALDFLLIDGYALQKQHEKSLECINRVNESLGGDAYLVSLRGLTLLTLERLDDAREAVQQAIRMEPDYSHMYWNAIFVALKTKHFDEVPELLDTVAEVAGVKIGDLKNAPVYAEFIESPEYSKWMESRSSR